MHYSDTKYSSTNKLFNIKGQRYSRMQTVAVITEQFSCEVNDFKEKKNSKLFFRAAKFVPILQAVVNSSKQDEEQMTRQAVFLNYELQHDPSLSKTAVPVREDKLLNCRDIYNYQLLNSDAAMHKWEHSVGKGPLGSQTEGSSCTNNWEIPPKVGGMESKV